MVNSEKERIVKEMNKRLKKKKGKQLIMKESYNLAPVYPYKKRKINVSKTWKMYHDAGLI